MFVVAWGDLWWCTHAATQESRWMDRADLWKEEGWTPVTFERREDAQRVIAEELAETPEEQEWLAVEPYIA